MAEDGEELERARKESDEVEERELSTTRLEVVVIRRCTRWNTGPCHCHGAL